jgi:hypothetical protein
MPRCKLGEPFTVYYKPNQTIPEGYSIRGTWRGPLEELLTDDLRDITSATSEFTGGLGTYIVRGETDSYLHARGTYECVEAVLIDESGATVPLEPLLDELRVE